jgi:hypothetical protein
MSFNDYEVAFCTRIVWKYYAARFGPTADVAEAIPEMEETVEAEVPKPEKAETRKTERTPKTTTEPTAKQKPKPLPEKKTQLGEDWSCSQVRMLLDSMELIIEKAAFEN